MTLATGRRSASSLKREPEEDHREREVDLLALLEALLLLEETMQQKDLFRSIFRPLKPPHRTVMWFA